MNFLDLPDSLSSFDQADVAVLSLPFEATTTYGKGTKNGPAAILKASSQIEWFDEELGLEPCRIGIAAQSPYDPLDSNPEIAVRQISEHCSVLLNRGKFVVGLGGEHTVSIGLVKAYKECYPDLWVLQLDAHSDRRQSYHNSPWNHACVMARIEELCPYVGIGIRSAIPGERETLPTPSRIYYAYEMFQNSNWPDRVLEDLGDPVFVTIDLDYFDPSVVPSVGTPEPGGFNWFETTAFLKRLARSHRVVGFDVVELSPKPGFVSSDFLAAKLAYKFIGYIFEDQLLDLGQEKA